MRRFTAANGEKDSTVIHPGISGSRRSRIMGKQQTRLVASLGPVLALSVLCAGCYHPPLCKPPDIPVPRELDKVTLPPYRIEPPDVVLLDVLRTVPLPPYRIQPLDSLLIRVTETLPNEPIDGTFVIE